jgi:steroid 5-alpha reductase family enzyme
MQPAVCKGSAMLWLIAAVAVGMVVVMTIGCVAQRQLRNAGWVDVFWTVGAGLGGAVCALWPLPSDPPPGWRKWFVAALVVAWSCRLGLHVALRVARSPEEDVRYRRFRSEWGVDFERRMFWFLMCQAPTAAVMDGCVMLAARNPIQGFRVIDAAGLIVVAASVAGEALADRQMHRFRSDPANRGRVCEAGLWGWSRHPNYFFEFALWLGYPLLALNFSGAWPWGWAAWLGPAAMWWFLTQVTGIPPLEREMVASRGDVYRSYQSRVSAFLPLPPKRRVRQTA